MPLLIDFSNLSTGIIIAAVMFDEVMICLCVFSP